MELVDMVDLKSTAILREGSNPFLRNIKFLKGVMELVDMIVLETIF